MVRDLVIRIDDRLEATDGRGIVDLRPEDFDARVEIIGPSASPPLEQVEFLGWSDGSTDPSRTASDIPGPVVQVGVEVRSRVVVQLAPDAPPGNLVVFTSPEVGTVEIPVGVPTWVVSSRAAAVAGALIPESVSYQAQSIVAADATVAALADEFTPTPEALWTVGSM